MDEREPTLDEMRGALMFMMLGVHAQAARVFGTKVRSGPFEGMEIPLHTPWDDGNFGSKLMGSYEHDLHRAVDHAVWRRPNVVVNVGAGEGYYAIGLARILREKAIVYALDTSEDARMLCSDYAERNDVRVRSVAGADTPEELSFEGVPGHRLYVVDVEGAEVELLDPRRCPELTTSDLIVECHDFLRPGASSIIADRFTATHAVTVIRPTLPDFARYTSLARHPSVMAVLMVLDKRPVPTYWLTCWANHKELHNG